MNDCPKCESVCKPAQCHTTCVAPQPKCAPVCEALDCNNKCVKPTNCAKPKCELQCEKPACALPDPTLQCCPCSTQANAQLATALAGTCTATVTVGCPSFVETMHTLWHKAQNGVEEQCCPCH